MAAGCPLLPAGGASERFKRKWHTSSGGSSGCIFTQMRGLGLRLGVAASLLASAVSQTWQLVRLGANSVASGARCLDGNAASYYIKAGVGANASNFVFFQQAGGWCMSIEDCYQRSLTSLGSTVADSATAS